MRKYLILKLNGPIQAWGGHTFEGYRPSELFPGRSHLLGLLGACLGIDRNDKDKQTELASSIGFAVRIDSNPYKMTDYHTVKDARVDYKGLASHETIVTTREYLVNARYSVAIWNENNSKIPLNRIEEAVKSPLFTPVLGRRSCPLTQPLFDSWQSANDVVQALASVTPYKGTIYSEEKHENSIIIRKRDIPIIQQPRQFASRLVYLIRSEEGIDVS